MTIKISDLWAAVSKEGAIYPKLFLIKEEAEKCSRMLYNGTGSVQRCFIDEN